MTTGAQEGLEARIDAATPDLIRVAKDAGEAILAVYRKDFRVDRKADNSPVTEADAAAESLILEALRRLTPDIPVVSEEAFSQGHSPDVSKGPFWLVDPLDGTKEFVRRNGEFSVNLGLIADGRPVAGLIYGPVCKKLYWANGGRAWKSEADGAWSEIRTRTPPPEGLEVFSSRTHRNPHLFDAFVEPLNVARVRHMGSSLKIAAIAAGEADLYPRFGPTMEWDTAAGHALIDAAGGRLVLPDESPLLYGKPGFENPSFVVWGK